MTLLDYNDTQHHYHATVNEQSVEVDAEAWNEAVEDLARIYFSGVLSWQDSHERAKRELSQAEAWMSGDLDGVRINGKTIPDSFQSQIEMLVRDGHITREPIWNQGIAVKYLKDEYQGIAEAELDKQGK